MKNLRKLGAAVVLTVVLALSAFAGETQTPPCAPGEIQTPPCAAAVVDLDTPTGDSTAPGDMGSGGALLTKLAADVLLSILPLF